MEGHIPVMLPEVLGALQPADGEIYIDGTYGGGGYARAILAAADCRLIGIDRDETAVARARHEADANPNLMPIAGRFGELDALARELGAEGVDGVVLDLGVSSFQLDEAERGFSFMRDGPLDMRMGQHGPNAADIVNRADEQDLADIIFRLGEERRSRRVARAIGQDAKSAPLKQRLILPVLSRMRWAGAAVLKRIRRPRRSRPFVCSSMTSLASWPARWWRQNVF